MRRSASSWNRCCWQSHARPCWNPQEYSRSVTTVGQQIRIGLAGQGNWVACPRIGQDRKIGIGRDPACGEGGEIHLVREREQDGVRASIVVDRMLGAVPLVGVPAGGAARAI